jgi:hypothetical protein
MTLSPDSLMVEFPGPVRVSGEPCLLPVSFCQDSFGNASRQVFEAPERSRVPSRSLLQPGTRLPVTGKKRFNTQ